MTGIAFWIFVFAATVCFISARKNLKIFQEEKERLCKINRLQDEGEEALNDAKENLARTRKILDEVGETYAPIVHAHWEWTGILEEKMFTCSHCGECAHYDGKTWWTDPFCWNCGAQMDEEVKHNEHE